MFGDRTEEREREKEKGEKKGQSYSGFMIRDREFKWSIRISIGWLSMYTYTEGHNGNRLIAMWLEAIKRYILVASYRQAF